MYMLRTSSYTIYVDLPDNQDEMLLVHGYTGAYDKVSRRVATYIRSLEVARPPRPLYGDWSPEPAVDGQVAAPSQQTIDTLKKRGYLTELSPEEEQGLFAKFAQARHTLASRQVNFIFMPTYDCNLRCSYCFQDHMRTDASYQHLLRTMRPKLVDRIFAALPQIEAHHGRPPSERPIRRIGFFGGEPLLERSRPIVEYIIQQAKQTSQASFWGVSNATDLHAYRDLLGPDGISFLQITLDGPAYEHDKRRIYADGSGSFERIAQNISMALDLGVHIAVRMNIDRNNIDQLPELADQIIARGWNGYRNFSAYTSPIHAANSHTSLKTTFSSWELDQALNKLREQDPDMYVIGRPDDRVMHQAKRIFDTMSEPSLQSVFCGAHAGMYLFDAFGDIYACWERTGDRNIRIGYITQDSEFVLEQNANNLWRSRNVTTNAICRKCRYAMYCGGGCAVLAENHRGEFFTNFCDGFAARFRASVAEAYGEHVIGLVPVSAEERACDL
jgi:uncharacterized protein